MDTDDMFLPILPVTPVLNPSPAHVYLDPSTPEHSTVADLPNVADSSPTPSPSDALDQEIDLPTPIPAEIEDNHIPPIPEPPPPAATEPPQPIFQKPLSNPRKTSRVIKPPVWHSDYITPTTYKCSYPMAHSLSYAGLSHACQAYLSVVSSTIEPTSFKEAS
ncbi:leucine-rich repeat extensin-like protein 1 [Lycium barbarum]|uniref:leucine-rich repeat extensin-like protein 1 n=1 Tax=Lycium barbarum TaxID=112863 RepID=UPI00293E8325|nr:leucine-rich repeat extensin-like protein 1 [Lycium barbarum]